MQPQEATTTVPQQPLLLRPPKLATSPVPAIDIIRTMLYIRDPPFGAPGRELPEFFVLRLAPWRKPARETDPLACVNPRKGSQYACPRKSRVFKIVGFQGNSVNNKLGIMYANP